MLTAAASRVRRAQSATASRGPDGVQRRIKKTAEKAGFVTRDPRAKERKKYGQKGARKRFQFSKR